jgi:hypothetical protein
MHLAQVRIRISTLWPLQAATSVGGTPDLKLPEALKSSTTSFVMSVTYTSPVAVLTATAPGDSNWPGPVAWLPNCDR